MSHDDDTPHATTRIPGERDWIKAKAGTLGVIATAVIGAAVWATKMTVDMAQVKSDLAELKAYVLPAPPITRAALEPHRDPTP